MDPHKTNFHFIRKTFPARLLLGGLGAVFLLASLITGQAFLRFLEIPTAEAATQINIPSGVFTAIAAPSVGQGIPGSGKHVSLALNPTNGRIYAEGGDYSNIGWQQSYQQGTFSLSLTERFANLSNPNAGWRVEFPFCGPPGGVQPKFPDYVGWTWDSKRKVFWMVPGVMDINAGNLCPGETALLQSDPGFKRWSLMTFDPVTQKWTVATTDVGPDAADTWQTNYDPQTDSLIRLGGSAANIYNITAGTWSRYNLPNNALGQTVRIWKQGTAIDVAGRVIYSVDGNAGRLHRFNIDSKVLQDLGPTPRGVGISANDEYVAWDSNNQILYYISYGSNNLYIYHPNNSTWETQPIVTNPVGIPFQARHAVIYDPFQDALVAMSGTDVASNPYMFLYRYKAGTPPPPPPPTITLSASPSALTIGNPPATLTWSSANATACSASGGWTGAKALSGTQTTGPLTTTTTYTLACTGAGGSTTQSTTVTVTPLQPNLPTVTLSASPASVTSGNSATLAWSATNATACTASNGWTGAKALSGTQTTGPLTTTTTYTLVCTGAGGSASQSTTVNVTSQPNLQGGQWSEIPNSKLASVLPNPLPPGNPRNIMSAWSGGALDTTRSRLIVTGGGGGDYDGNELYAFDVNAGSWSRVWGPSPNSAIPRANGQGPGTPGCNINTYSDGNPVSRHSYGGLTYIPTLDQFWMGGGAQYCTDWPSKTTWTFSFGTNTWSRKADNPWNPELGMIGVYDPRTQHVFYTTNQTAPLSEYDPVANTWTQRASQWASGALDSNGFTGAIDPKRNKLVAIGRGTIVSWDLNIPGLIPRQTLSTSGDKTAQNADSPGFEYVPTIDRFVAWAGGTAVYVLDMDTLVWTKVSAASTNVTTPTAPNPNGTFGRFRYVPSSDAFVLVNNIDENVFMYKLPGSLPIVPVPPTISLSASPASVTSGNSATLAWSATNATACTASNGWTGAKALSGTQTTGPLTTTTTYTLACTGAGGSTTQSTTVTVTPLQPNLPTVTLSASPASVTSGNSATLAWSATNATACTASNGWTGAKALSGTQTTGPLTTTTTYTLACTGAGGSASQNVNVAVTTTPPPVSDFKAGDRVKAIDNVNVRTWGSTEAVISGIEPTGSFGTIVDVDGLWLKIRWDDGQYGMSLASFVVVVRNPLPLPATFIPKGLTASGITETSATVSWAPRSQEQESLIGYKVFRSGLFIDTTKTPSFTIRNLLPGTTTPITVSAYSRDGSESAQASLLVTTLGTPPGHGIVPSVSLIAPSENSLVSDTVALLATVSSNVSKVEFYVDGRLKSTSAALSTDHRYSWDATERGTHPCQGPHAHSLTVLAYEKSGNVASASARVRMDDLPHCQREPVIGGTPPPVIPEPMPDTLPFYPEPITEGERKIAEDTEAPWLDVTGLNVGARLSLAHVIRVKAGDNVKVASIQLSINGEVKQRAEGTTLAYTVFGPSYRGTHTMIITAADPNGNKKIMTALIRDRRVIATRFEGVLMPPLPPPPSETACTLTASPPSIQAGSSATISWTTSHAASLSIDQSLGSVTPIASGSRAVSPTETTTYTGTAAGASGSTATCVATVNVTSTPPPNLPTVTLSASPASVTSGNSATLAWSATNATACTASNGWTGAKALSGTQTTGPLTTTTTYTLACTGAGGSATQSTTVTVTPPTTSAVYRNPILPGVDSGDPSILKYNGTYYLYGSMPENRVYTSSAMHGPWTKGPSIVTTVPGMHYAPHVIGPINGVFYDYYVEQGRNVVATGPSPTQLTRLKPLIEGGGDPWFFEDDDGQKYLYYAIWVNIGGKGQAVIRVRRMTDYVTLANEADTTVLTQTPSATWEKETVEQPAVFKRNGIYYMIYSAGNFTYTYATGYATATNPMGPWTKYAGNPIMSNGNGVTGPGAGSPIIDGAGEMWLVYHQKDTPTTTRIWDRVATLDKLVFNANGVMSIRATKGIDVPAPSK